MPKTLKKYFKIVNVNVSSKGEIDLIKIELLKIFCPKVIT